MLIKNYKPTKMKRLNNNNISKDRTITKAYKWIKYPTTDLSVFDFIEKKEVFKLIEEQSQLIRKEADLYYKYSWLSKTAYDNTLEQYKIFYYHNWFFYDKVELKHFLLEKDKKYNTTPNDILQNPNTLFENKEVVEISREAIRNITWYSAYFTPTYWDWPTEYVGRQEEIIEDESDIILIVACRQSWKSYALAEKAIEESYLPDNNILVWAFTAKSTNIIRNYIRKFMSNFPEWDWMENKKENYMLNLETGSRINFFTLADDAVDSVRWLTLNTVIVDEAQLVSTYAYLEVLEPTLATTWWKMILAWTPPKAPVGYYAEQIFDYKKWELDDTSFYEIKLTDQPFAHPKIRAKIMKRLDNPIVQRERFCNFAANVDALFNIEKATSFPIQNSSSYYVLWIDPARLKDRSWYSILQICNWKIYVVESWFVPNTHKKDWKLQWLFFKKIVERFENIITVMDFSGVWDWVYTIFKTLWLNINYTVRYTAGATQSLKLNNYTVSKSILINTLLDFITEDQIELIDITNKYLSEELMHITEAETRTKMLTFTTKFYDDITNSLMIASFITKEKKLLSKWPIQNIQMKQATWNPIIDWIEWRWPQRKLTKVW